METACESVKVVTLFFLVLVWVSGLFALCLLAAARVLGDGENTCVFGLGPTLVEFCLGRTRYRFRVILVIVDVESDGNHSWLQGGAMFGLASALLLGLTLAATYLILLTGVQVPRRPGALVIDSPWPSEVLDEGDIIVRVGDLEVGDALDLARELTRWDGGPVEFEVERGGVRRVVGLRGTVEGERRGRLVVRTVSGREYPGPLAAAAMLPRAVVGIFGYQAYRGYSRDEHLRVRLPEGTSIVFLLFVFGPFMFAWSGLVLVCLSPGISLLAGRQYPPALQWCLVAAFTTVSIALVILPLWLPNLAGWLFPRPLFDVPLLVDALRGLPVETNWRILV